MAEIQFVWEPYLPVGELTLVCGLAGVGKSSFMAKVAGELYREQLETAWISSDDSPQVLERMFKLQGAEHGVVSRSLVTSQLAAAIDGAADTGAKLVVFDSLNVALGGVALNVASAVLSNARHKAEERCVAVAVIGRQYGDGGGVLSSSNPAMGMFASIINLRPHPQGGQANSGKEGVRVAVHSLCKCGMVAPPYEYKFTDDGAIELMGPFERVPERRMGILLPGQQPGLN